MNNTENNTVIQNRKHCIYNQLVDRSIRSLVKSGSNHRLFRY